MAFLYSILPEYTKNNDILTDVNARGTVKVLEEYLNVIDENIFDIVSDSVMEILSYTSITNIRDEYLPYLAFFLGYKWNDNLDVAFQRNLLINIIELYKRKGTKFSFNFNLYQLDPDIELYEPYKDIFVLNKSGFDKFTTGYIWREPVVAATTENITLSGEQTIDNVEVKSGDRVLVKDQIDLSENGVYIVSDITWTRASDSTIENLENSIYFVKEGLINKSKGFYCKSAADGGDIIFERLSYQQDSKKHLTSRDYYSWGIIVLKIKEAATAVYDLFAMVKPGGWKILLETEYGLYYNLYYKIDSVLRDYAIQQSGVTETDYEDYDYYTDVLHALQYGEKKLYVDITFVGQMFDLYGNYFDSFANNSITLEEIEQYNLYYESNDNKFTLLRYSTHYSSYSVL